MNRSSIVTSAILWAASIVAAAIAGAPAFVTLVLLPALASIALVTGISIQRRRCYADAPAANCTDRNR